MDERRKYLSAAGEETEEENVKAKEDRRKPGEVKRLKVKRSGKCMTEGRYKTQGRNRRRQREGDGAAFEYIMHYGMGKSHAIDGVYLPEGFTGKFSTAAGWKVEPTDNQ